MSGTTAEPAAGEGSSEARKGGWLTQVWPGTSPADPAEEQADAEYVGANSKRRRRIAAIEPTRGDTQRETARKTFSDPVRSTTRIRCPGASRHLRREKRGRAAAPACSSWAASNTPPAYTTRAAPSWVKLNPLLPGLAIYGDWRTAVAYNNNNGKDIAQIATRLNVDVDFKITGTERIHAFFTPLQKNNKIHPLRVRRRRRRQRFNGEFDLNPQTLFFEGDFGSLYSGFSGTEARSTCPSLSVSSRCSCRTGPGRTTRSSAAR